MHLLILTHVSLLSLHKLMKQNNFVILKLSADQRIISPDDEGRYFVILKLSANQRIISPNDEGRYFIIL